MNDFEEKKFFEELRNYLKDQKLFLGLPVERDSLKSPEERVTEEEFVELSESDLKNLKDLNGMVVAEMKDGKEYYIVPSYQDDEAILEDVMEQHPQFVRISDETVINVLRIDKFDEPNRTVFFTTQDGEVTHRIEDEFWDDFITAYRIHRN